MSTNQKSLIHSILRIFAENRVFQTKRQLAEFHRRFERFLEIKKKGKRYILITFCNIEFTHLVLIKQRHSNKNKKLVYHLRYSSFFILTIKYMEIFTYKNYFKDLVISECIIDLNILINFLFTRDKDTLWYFKIIPELI